MKFIKERIKHLDRAGIVYTLMNFFIYAVYFLRALLIPKLLDSYSYGVFSVFNLYLRFATIFDLGSVSYLQKEVAVNRHTKIPYDYKLERQVIVLNSFLVLLSTLFFFLINRDIVGKVSLLDGVFWVLIAAFSQLFVIRTGILRSLEKFKLLSRVVATNALLSLTIVVFFVLDIKNIYIIYFVYLTSVFLPTIFYITRVKLGSLFPLTFLRHSWPIFLYNILFYLYVNIDKFIIKDKFSFIEFSSYSLYSTIVTSIFMAVSLLWAMFYSRIFNQGVAITEKLDTINAVIILLCVCALKGIFPVFNILFPNYVANAQFYDVSLQYAGLAYFLPNTLIKYLNNRRILLFVCAIVILHLTLVLLANELANILSLLPVISWLTYFFIELLGVKSHNKLLFLVRIVSSILVVLICIR